MQLSENLFGFESSQLKERLVEAMLKYWVWLATRKHIGARSAYLLLRHFGSPQAIYLADEAAYQRISFLRNKPSLLDKSLSGAEGILRSCYEKGIFLLTMQDAAYPERLRAMDDPPLVLYGKGILPNLSGPVIGVVGTRRSSLYGMDQARRMGYGLSHCGAVVVSGGAKGIDTEALKGALMGGSPVMAVLGCGVDVVYPAENRKLFQEITENGCLLSEYPPGTKPHKEHFPPRNRIISGLSAGVLVVECPNPSGALITARKALNQGRDVFALPANVGQKTAVGNLDLLREGAIMVCEPWQILEEYVGLYPQLQNRDCGGWEKEMPAEVSKVPDEKGIDKPKTSHYIDAKKMGVSLSPEEQRLVTLLEQGPVHIDVLSEQMGQTAGGVLALLTMLEVRGLIQRLPGRVFSLAEAKN